MFSKRAYLNRFFFLAVLLCLPPRPSLGAQPPLEFWIHPYMQAPELVRRFTPLAQYLELKTGQKIKIMISKTYENHRERIGEGRTDLAFVGPFGYSQIVEMYGTGAFDILAALEVDGKVKFHGVIVTRSEAAINNLQDLPGRSFAFGDKISTAGTMLPSHMLKMAGVELEHLGRYRHLSSHNDVALAVLGGAYEAGAMKDSVFEEYAHRGLKAIAKSPAIPEHLFLAGSRLPAPLVASLRQAMLELKNPEILTKIQKGVTRLVAATDKDYKEVHDICRKQKCQSGLNPRK